MKRLGNPLGGMFMKRRIFSLLLSLPLLLSLFPSAQAQSISTGFPLSTSPWAGDEIMAVYERGLVTFSPDLGSDYTQPITRGQLVRMMVELILVGKGLTLSALTSQLGVLTEAPLPGPDSPLSPLPPVTGGSFTDTQDLCVELAARLGIVQGYDGRFSPNDLVTRQEATIMMHRCMNWLGIVDANCQPQVFSDAYTFPAWSRPSIRFLSGRTSQEGKPIMSGHKGRFSPLEPYTIEQAILSVGRMYSSLSVKDVYPDWQTSPGYDQVTLALTFGGDCTLGRHRESTYGNSLDEMYALKGPAYFFSGIPHFFDDDLTMVNFEGTLTNSTQYADKKFVFKGPPKYAEILPLGSIDVVTVANNHSHDYLSKGFEDTIKYLSPVVQVSGYGEYMPIVTVKGVKVGFASNVGWSFDRSQKQFIKNAIASLRERGAEIIVFNYHWGVERVYQSNATQQAIAHYCIDQGADLVIGHHPHVVQEVETYQGKQIAYSLGNLVFGGNKNPNDKNCLIFRQNFTVDLDSRAIVDSSYEAIPYRISSVNWRNDYHPVPAGKSA